MKAAHDASDLKAWAKADEEFHGHLVVLSGNRILNEILNDFWGRAQRARITMLNLRKSSEESAREHAKLVESIRQGDSAGARETLEAHRKRGAANFKRLAEQSRNPLTPPMSTY